MPMIVTSKSAVLRFSDGTRTYDMFPQDGDVEITPGDDTFIEVKHRGQVIADGEGIISQESGYCRVSFTLHAHDFTDAVKADALLRWMRNSADTSAAAVPTASWASTTTRTDAKATLHVQWWPHGTGTGKRYATVEDCLLLKRTIKEGSPTVITVEVMSTTARDEIWATA